MDPQNLKSLEKFLDEWTSTPLGRRSFLASLPFLIASCATPAKTRYREGDNTGQSTSLTVADEKKMTQEVLPQLKKDYPAFKNSEAQSYIQNLGLRIATRNGLEKNPYAYNFTVVDSPHVNAFALPAGTVFVTVPLIAMAETEAELAGVVGHEIGHIQARHTAERMDKAKKEQSQSWKYAVGGSLLGGLLGYGLGRLACPPKDDKCLRKATEMGVGAGVAGGLLIQKYGFMANSREDEMEADRISFRTSVKSGYHKDYVGLFYTKLLKMEQQSRSQQPQLLKSLQDALSTHPPSQERVSQMKALMAEEPLKTNALVSTRSFDQIKSICIKHLSSQKKTA